MSLLIDRPTRVLVMRDSEAVEVHQTVLEAVATQSTMLRQLLEWGTCPYEGLLNDVDNLLELDPEPKTPKAWRFVQTSHGYLGPAFFATNPEIPVATCDDSQVWITNDGFTFSTLGRRATLFMAIETDGDETALIFPDGTESAPLNPAAKRLARYLSDSHNYVTGTPTGFLAGVETFLHKLRARLPQGAGPNVDLI